jgi:hypothetical protein
MLAQAARLVRLELEGATMKLGNRGRLLVVDGSNRAAEGGAAGAGIFMLFRLVVPPAMMLLEKPVNPSKEPSSRSSSSKSEQGLDGGLLLDVLKSDGV